MRTVLAGRHEQERLVVEPVLNVEDRRDHFGTVGVEVVFVEEPDNRADAQAVFGVVEVGRALAGVVLGEGVDGLVVEQPVDLARPVRGQDVFR
ncbi:hypothetical protein [Amycolatopsis sp. NPDC004169]|uniref:hypothetical protein n=1 Tax=Amycolatopsis sp. NPDC004169 TaxID=3154453 RepID=UPI0033BC4BDF